MERHIRLEVPERRLISIPIVHAPADLGTFQAAIQGSALRRQGERLRRHKDELIQRRWMKIEKVIEGLKLSYHRVRLYQDGLPICGREVEIVAELANQGSQNHRLLLRMMEQGAALMGTESAELLVEEYELFKTLVNEGESRKVHLNPAGPETGGEALLKRRDEYIAHRINETLCPGETGILFLGALHSLEAGLDRDIRLIYPMGRVLDRRKR